MAQAIRPAVVTLRAAAASALSAGCGFLVYADPLPHDA